MRITSKLVKAEKPVLVIDEANRDLFDAAVLAEKNDTDSGLKEGMQASYLWTRYLEGSTAEPARALALTGPDQKIGRAVLMGYATHNPEMAPAINEVFGLPLSPAATPLELASATITHLPRAIAHAGSVLVHAA